MRSWMRTQSLKPQPLPAGSFKIAQAQAIGFTCPSRRRPVGGRRRARIRYWAFLRIGGRLLAADWARERSASLNFSTVCLRRRHLGDGAEEGIGIAGAEREQDLAERQSGLMRKKICCAHLPGHDGASYAAALKVSISLDSSAERDQCTGAGRATRSPARFLLDGATTTSYPCGESRTRNGTWPLPAIKADFWSGSMQKMSVR